MSVICQTFVQNAWRKDLCSNCFKSKDEHGGRSSSAGGGKGGGRKEGAGEGGGGGGGGGGGIFSRSGLGSEGLGLGVGGGSRRYMGVAGSVYQRSYYNQNSWKSIMIDNSDSGLRSPGLIKGMSNLVSQENEKNLKLSDLGDSGNNRDSLRSSRLVQQVKTSHSEARLLTEILGDKSEEIRVAKLDDKGVDNSEKQDDKGDVSSDLGSETSNVSSSSAVSSSCSYEVTSAANSDTTSLKSEPGSDHSEEEKDEAVTIVVDEEEEKESHEVSELDGKEEVMTVSILKKPGDSKGIRGSISFCAQLEEVIGYGGDVDYSGDEDDEDDDDDDDFDFDDLTDLTPEERVLRRETDKNTDFNSDNDNLKKDIEELLPSVKELEEKRKMIIAEIEELERLGRENKRKNERIKQEEKKEEKPEGKVKLKRSPPLVTIKPLIARNNTEVRVNQVLPMKNGEVVRLGNLGETEEIPLKGIKPKYVSQEEEMIEKTDNSEMEVRMNTEKVTSIDSLCGSTVTKNEKVTSIDDICIPTSDETVKSAEIVPNIRTEVQESIVPVKEILESSVRQSLPESESKTPPSSSVTPCEYTSTERLSCRREPQTKKQKEQVSETKPISTSSSKGKAKDATNSIPVSAPRKSLTNQNEQKSNKRPTEQSVIKKNSVPLTSSSQGKQKGTSQSHAENTSKSSTVSTSSIEAKGDKIKSKNLTSSNASVSEQKRDQKREVSANESEDSESKRPQDAKVSTKGTVHLPSVKSVENINNSGTKSSKVSNRTQVKENPPDHKIPSVEETNATKNKSKSETPETSSDQKVKGSALKAKEVSNLCSGKAASAKVTTKLPDESPVEAKKESTIISQPECLVIHQKASVNHYRLETPKVTNNQKEKEPPLTLNHQIQDDVENNQNYSHSPKSSNQNSPEISKTPISRQSSSSSNPKTPTNQAVLESPKMPASRQSSNSSLLTTFGTPLILTSSTPQNSFLHSSSPRTVYDDTLGSSSPIYSPATSDFLKDIKSQPEVPTPTAGIQKSALYASTSCLKGLPGAKPVITPKPPSLKDKPKVPFKPSASGSRIYATPAPITPTKVTNGNQLSAVSTPSVTTGDADHGKHDNPTMQEISESSSPVGNVSTVTPEQKKPPPTIQAPAIPNGKHQIEAVYDIPVTVPSSVSPSSRDLSSTGSYSFGTEKKEDDATIYHEIDDTIRSGITKGNSQLHSSAVTSLASPPPESLFSPSSVSRQESTRCQSRSTFEANRSLLSAALDFGTRATRSSSSKRPAPRPPPEDEEEQPDEGSEVAGDPPLPPESEDNPQGGEEVVDTNDGESYSSFTDDFDDDDEEEEEEDEELGAPLTLRKAERSSSAIPYYRNSVGPIMTTPPSGTSKGPSEINDGYQVPSLVPSGPSSGSVFAKPPASRSHSLPRATEHMVIIHPSPMSVVPTSSAPPSSSSSSKFSFGKSGFFRPASPPTNKRDSASDRGRDRTKKTSKFSLKKFLRLGGKDDEKKTSKEHERRLHRESKKGKLQIIHPLDYNQNGVEVIARPEKTSPIYDYTGIYGYIPPPQLTTTKTEDVYAPPSTQTQVTTVQASPAPSQASKRSECSTESTNPHYATVASSFTLSSSTIPVSAASASPLPSTITSTSPTSSSVAGLSNVVTYSALPTASTTTTTTTSTSTSTSSSALEKRSSFLKRESGLERRESGASYSSSNNSGGSSQGAQHHLGYNSEGRPRPPPPPRKVSLENGQNCDIYSSVVDINTPARQQQDSSTPMDTPSRPQRPPPPTRTPSNAGIKAGPPRPDPPRLGRDSVYANLGDVRAPITPRKPGRTSSIRGEEDREKRRAPQPPSVMQEPGQQVMQRTIKHQHQDSTSSSCSSISSSRAAKGPAPARPPHQYSHSASNEYETMECDGSNAVNVTQIAVGSSASSSDNVYKIPQVHYQVDDANSASSSSHEKMSRTSVRRSSAITHRSLEDQYGAVISANLDALSNMLDQMSKYCYPSGYEDLSHRLSRLDAITLDEDIVVGAGHRLFYVGVAFEREITLMLTPETKVESHHLLNPLPIVTFKDDLPSHLVSRNTITRGKTTPGTVWVLPPLNLTTLRTVAEERLSQLSVAPLEWERHTCLLLLQLVTGLKQLQAQGVEETSIDLTLVVEESELRSQECQPRLMLVPPSDTGMPLLSLCECAATATLMMMGIESSLEEGKRNNFVLPPTVPSQQAFQTLLQILIQEKAGSLTQVKCVLEILLFGPENSGVDGKNAEEIEAGLQRWLDLERATVLHSLIRGPLESSVLKKFHLLFLIRTNARVLRETLKLIAGSEVTMF